MQACFFSFYGLISVGLKTEIHGFSLFFVKTRTYYSVEMKRLFLLFYTLTLGLYGSEALTKEQAITLGIIQGATEFLPVSSTGHMVLANEILFKDTYSSEKKVHVDNYMVYIQIGTILTLLLFYRKHVLRILRGWIGKDKLGFRLGLNVGVAFIPAGLLGFFCDGFIQKFFYTRNFIAASLLVGGVIILLLEAYRKRCPARMDDIYQLTVHSAWIIGLFQMIALWPGFSRSLATIIGGIVVGFNLVQAIHFSFLLGLLTSSVASGYKLLKSGKDFFEAIPWDINLLGVFVAFIVGWSTIAIFLRYIKRNGLRIFGWYRILIGILLSIF